MKVIHWLATLVLVAVCFFGLFSYKQALTAHPENPGEQFEPAATVDAQTVLKSDFQQVSKVHGELVATANLQLRNQLAGVITFINLPSGQIVEKGQRLIELDHSDEDAKLIAAKARLTLAKQTLTRYEQLQKRNEISKELFDKATSDFAIAQSEVAQLQAIIAKKVIIAPFKALVGLHNLVQGQYLEAGTNIVNLLGASDKLWVEFSMPQTFAPLANGQTVTIHLLGRAEQYDARIIASEPVYTQTSRQLVYRAELTNTAGLRPQSLVNVEVPVGNVSQQFSIDEIALTHDQFGDYVFVLNPQDDGSYRAQRVKVNTIDRVAGKAIIESGISEQQTVATTGAFKLRDGMKVFIKQMQD